MVKRSASRESTLVAPRARSISINENSALLPKNLGKAKATSYSSSDGLSSVEAAENDPAPEPTPLPKGQIRVLLFGQLPEPMASSVIYPFINELVGRVGITGGDDRKIGYYAGIIESLFFLAEFCFVLQWGKLSDRIGRKPVLIMGLLGLSLSITSFGLETTYIGLIISRALAGILSGNVGVFKSVISEITDETNIAEGFAVIQVVWASGATLGPLIGGFFSNPNRKFPALFSGQFWIKYPYFLPCGIVGFICILAALTIWLFLEESLPSLKERASEDKKYTAVATGPKVGAAHERSQSQRTLVGDGQLADEGSDGEPDYGALGQSSQIDGALSPIASESSEGSAASKQPRILDILTKKVIIAIGTYAIAAILDISYSVTLPLVFATRIEHGGLGLSPPRIGIVLGATGLINGFVQGILTPKIQRYVGNKRLYIMSIACFAVSYGMFPILNAIARVQGMSPLVWVLICVQFCVVICAYMSYGCTFIFITSASEKSALGATNGVAQSVVSLMRMVGPASATSLFALSTEKHILGGNLSYFVFMTVTLGGVLWGTMLPSQRTRGF